MKQKTTAVPTPQQSAWQDFEMGMFCHFGPNTFADREWGEGKDSPSIFNPEAFDARQWVNTAKQAGFRYLILTAKHHDGFCLWPTETTDYSVKSSPWKGGKGDVVRECADACREAGMRFGLYLSPWDRHEPCYPDKEAYDNHYCRQLTELLKSYGPLTEVWFDGAGSEGREYDWKRYMDIVRELQPDAMVFNMGRPTIRWVGNENGTAPYPCWNEASDARLNMFTKDMATWLPDTPLWVPAECDVSIRRPKWFWHPDEDHTVLSLDDLMDIYYNTIGHGANLLLNIAPDRRGLLPEADVQRVLQFGDEIRRLFSTPAGETAGSGKTVTLDFDTERKIDRAVIMEDIREGERIREYILEGLTAQGWAELAHGSAVGHKKIDLFAPSVVKAIRIRVLDSTDTPLIRSLKAFDAE